MDVIPVNTVPAQPDYYGQAVSKVTPAQPVYYGQAVAKVTSVKSNVEQTAAPKPNAFSGTNQSAENSAVLQQASLISLIALVGMIAMF